MEKEKIEKSLKKRVGGTFRAVTNRESNTTVFDWTEETTTTLDGIKSIYDHLFRPSGIFVKDLRYFYAVQIYNPEIVFLYVRTLSAKNC